MESEISRKRPKSPARLKLIKKAKKHHFKPQPIDSSSRRQKPFLTNHFHGLASYGLSDHGLRAGYAETQQPQRPLPFAKSESFTRRPSKQQTGIKGTQEAFSQQKLMAIEAEKTTTSKDLKSYVGEGASYLPTPSLSSNPSSQMPNQSKISFNPQAASSIDTGSGSGKLNFIEEQSLGEAEVSTNYNGEQVKHPIRDHFQLPGSLNSNTDA